MRSARIVVIYTVAALAIASNWLIFVWAVSINQIVQISLGYFINPLLSVVFGMLVFHERLRWLQWVSVALAAAGVVYLTVALDALPWIALWLAASFGSYGLMKKLAPLGPVQGLTFETGILFIPAAAYLIVEAFAGRGAFMHAGPLRNLLMLASGPVTTLPLLMFAAGVRRIPLSLVGMLQYINPTLQITIAVMLYGDHLRKSSWSDSVWSGPRWRCLPSRDSSPGDGRNWPSRTFPDSVMRVISSTAVHPDI